MKASASSENWTSRSTRDLIAEGKLTIGDGYRAKNSELSTSGLPFARAGNIDGGFRYENADRFPEADLKKVGSKVSQPGDVVFTSKGTVGRFAFVRSTTPRFVYSPQLCYWRTHDPETIDACWLYYWMLGGEFAHQVSSVKGQTDMADYVSLSDQRQMEITLPPAPIQRAIADVLGALDDKIEQNRRTAQVLERLARAIFRAWFVDFEPVKAKAAGATAFPSMPQTVFDTLPTRFVDSEIGPVPEGWEVKTIGELCEINARNVRQGEVDGEIEYIDIASVTVGQLDRVQRVPFAEAPSRARRRVRHGDTIWSCVRPNRRSYLFIHSPSNELVVSTGFAVLSPTKLGPAFLYQAVTQPEFVDYLVSNADGSAYPAVRWDHFASAKLSIPSSLLLEAFDDLAMPMRGCVAAAARESSMLAGLRDFLLPKLLCGQVRVKVAEHAVERSD